MAKSPDQIKKVVEKVVGALKSRGVKIDKLILYGSQARGKAGPDSDIDLAVISRSFNKKGLLKRQELLGEAIFGLKEPVELIGYSYKEYERNPKFTFLSAILSEGQVVYEEYDRGRGRTKVTDQRNEDRGTRRRGDAKTRRHGDREMGKNGDAEK